MYQLHLDLTIKFIYIIYPLILLLLLILLAIYVDNLLEVKNFWGKFRRHSTGQWSRVHPLTIKNNLKHIPLNKILELNAKGYIYLPNVATKQGIVDLELYSLDAYLDRFNSSDKRNTLSS